jgi:hypothetical protein
MWRIVVVLLFAAIGCSRQGSDDASKAVNHQEEKPVGGKTIRVVVHRKPFKFDGVDRISILGVPLNEVESPIPFPEKEVDEEQVPYEQSKHGLDTGEAPDFIHRFKRPDGYFVDFLIKDNRIANLIESTRPYLKGRP